MCGLVGILGDKLRYQDHKLFTDMLEADQIRGRHSTGVVSVATKQVYVHKKALQGSDFVQLGKSKEVIARADTLLIGHNRYATKGALTDENAHPFIEDTVHLVHNGTITNQWELVPNSHTRVDSQVIAEAMSQTSNEPAAVIELLEKLDGAYCLIWFDTRDNKVKFARNAERPLGMHITGNGRLVWSSDGKLAESLLSHHGVSIKSSYELTVGKLTCIDVDTLDPEYHDFTPLIVPPVNYNNWYGTGGARGTHRKKPEVTPAKKSQTLPATYVKEVCTDAVLLQQFPIGQRVKFYATNLYGAEEPDEVEAWCVDYGTSTYDVIANLPKEGAVTGGLYEGRVTGYTLMWEDYWVVDVEDSVSIGMAGTPVECDYCTQRIEKGEDTETVGQGLLHSECYENYVASITC